MDTHHLNIAGFPIYILIKMVAGLLESVIHTNDTIPSSTNNITLFHSRAVPNIKIEAYLARIQKYTPYTNEALLSILVFFDRISKQRPKFALNSFNIHRMVIASIVVASKFTSDIFYSNARYAKVGGVPLLELNKLEVEFLFLCNFDLHVRLETLQEYGDQLLNHSILSTTASEPATLNFNGSSKRKWEQHSATINTSSNTSSSSNSSSSSSSSSSNNNKCSDMATPVPSPHVVRSVHGLHTHHHTDQQRHQTSAVLPLTPPMNDQEQDLKRRRKHSSPIPSLVSSSGGR